MVQLEQVERDADDMKLMQAELEKYRAAELELGLSVDEITSICAQNNALRGANRRLIWMLHENMLATKRLKDEIATVETIISTCLKVLRASGEIK